VAKQDESTVVQRLRFPEFIGQALREVRLGDVTAESAIRNGDKLAATSVMGVSKVDGIVPMEERIIASDVARYKVVEKDWFAYNPMRLNIGSIARWRGEADILVSPDYVVFRCLDDPASGIEPDYLDHFRQSAAWDAFVSEGGDGGVRVRIYYKDLARLGLALPMRAEQQKIADCLTSLDKVIAAQGRKVETLKTYRRGLVQWLFPAEGQAVPRLRFPEFRGGQEWKETRLEEISKLVRGPFGGSLKKEAFVARGYAVYEQSHAIYGDFGSFRYFITEKKFAELRRFAVAANDIIMSCSGTMGKFSVVPDGAPDGVINQALLKLSPSPGYNPRFIVEALQLPSTQRSLLSQSGGGAIQNVVSVEQIKALRLQIPEKLEQNKIVEFLSCIDAQVLAASEKLDALETHKTGLMQELFPALEEA
jgi:type I restriction enzyme, S subunit